MTNQRKEFVYNPLRGSMWLPGIDLREIDWSPVRELAEPTAAAEEQRVRTAIMARVTAA